MNDKTVKKLQKTSVGAQYPVHTEESRHFPPRPSGAEFPDVGETTKSDPVPEKVLVRCARCGIEKQGWTGGEGQGIVQTGQTYCCQACAENRGCDCVDEIERHTGINAGA